MVLFFPAYPPKVFSVRILGNRIAGVDLSYQGSEARSFWDVLFAYHSSDLQEEQHKISSSPAEIKRSSFLPPVPRIKQGKEIDARFFLGDGSAQQK